MTGFSPQASSPVSLYTQAGFLISGCIPTRRADKISLGFAWARLGQNAIGTAAKNSWPAAGYESVLEGTWVLQATPAFALQPDLQYVIHPGATERHANSVVVGIRAVLEL
jgi:porin